MNELLTFTVKETVPRKILISSEAGSGKTTMMEKFALDWAKGCIQVNELNSFMFVFLVRLCLLKDECSLADYCYQEYVCERLSSADFRTLLMENKVLFLLDGWDEFDHSNVPECINLLKGNIYPHSTIIVSTRPGITDIKRYFDIGYHITPLSESDIQTFLTRYNSTRTNCPDVILPSVGHPLRPLVKVPLFLWFTVLLCDDLYHSSSFIPKTRTDFYDRIIEALIKRCLKKASNHEKTEKMLQEAISALECRAYRCLCQDKLYFEDEDMPDNVLTLGIVSKQLSQNRLSGCICYIFNHKSLLEYLAARHISTFEHANILAGLIDIKEYSDLTRREASMFLYFLFGHLRHKPKICRPII